MPIPSDTVPPLTPNVLAYASLSAHEALPEARAAVTRPEMDSELETEQ